MKKLIFALSILAMVVMACSTTTLVTPLPTDSKSGADAGITKEAAPTYTPYPTQVPPTAYPTQIPPTAVPQRASIDGILVSLSFYDDGYQCPTACNSYTYSSGNVVVSAITYPNGDFSLSAPITGGFDTSGEGTILGNILYKAVPYDVGMWIINNMTNATYSGVGGTMNGYRVTESFSDDQNGNTWIIIVIDPPTGPTGTGYQG